MDLVLDIGNHRIKGAFFEEDEIAHLFKLAPDAKAIGDALAGKQTNRILISSVNEPVFQEVCRVLVEQNFSYELLDFKNLKLSLDVDEPDQVGHDRIANCYGALKRFPQNDCIIVDIGTAITFDYVTASGRYLGGAIAPGMNIEAKALSTYTNLLPEVEIAKPKEALAKTTETHIQSGLYYGLLGAVERITFEMRKVQIMPSDVSVVATGGIFQEPIGEALAKDVIDIVDLIDPALTLIGIYEIMKE